MTDPDPQASSVDPFVAQQLQQQQLDATMFRKERCSVCLDGIVFLSEDYEKTCLQCNGRGWILVKDRK